MKVKRRDDEHQIQAGAFKLIRLLPEPYRSMFAIPNGGMRNLIVAKKLKAEGQLSGVPDTFLACARRGYHGLFIEYKSAIGQLSPEQKTMIAKLEAEGYCVEVARSIGEAMAAIDWYREGQRT
jgi:hypothetical protein